MKLNSNKCVRTNRDKIIIQECQQFIKEIELDIHDYSQLYHLIGNSVRIKILCLLRNNSRLCVCDLGEILQMTIPAISQHLKKLKQGNLIISEREGTTIYQSLNPMKESQLFPIFERLRYIDQNIHS